MIEDIKRGGNISDTLTYCFVCHFFVLITFFRHLWSITEQMYSNMESICSKGELYHMVYFCNKIMLR